MKTCLEKVSMQERSDELTQNTYNSDNAYSSNHQNALNIDHGDDEHGKGTGSAGHSHWLPNCDGEIGIINYSNFDTDVSSHAGNKTDNKTRTTAMARSLYNADNPYSADIIDTSDNVAQGQYKMP